MNNIEKGKILLYKLKEKKDRKKYCFEKYTKPIHDGHYLSAKVYGRQHTTNSEVLII